MNGPTDQLEARLRATLASIATATPMSDDWTAIVERLDGLDGDAPAPQPEERQGWLFAAAAVVAVLLGGYLLLDRDERRDLKDVPRYNIGSERRHLGKPTIAGDQLYTADRQAGLVTITDIADPFDPKLIKQFQLPGNPSRCVVHDGVLVIPDGYHGLLVFDR